MNRRGSILIMVLFVVAILAAFSVAGLTRCAQELKASELFVVKNQSFTLAEAGIDQADKRLADPIEYFTLCNQTLSGRLGAGSYSAEITCPSVSERKVVSTGTASWRSMQLVSSVVEVYIAHVVPTKLIDYTVWASHATDISGNAYGVVGDVMVSTPVVNGGNIDGIITVSSDADPLPKLDYTKLYAVAKAQGNVYDDARMKAQPFPTSFWYRVPSDPNDPSTGVPNVVIVDGDLVLNGKTPTMGGFYVVTGSTSSTTVNGNAEIDGVIYTNKFVVNGGGNRLNINGAVWTNEFDIQGNVEVAGNSDYMTAISSINPQLEYGIVSWVHTQ
jgi:hypothetical protein